MAPHTGSPASSASSSATRSSDKDRQHRAKLQAYYVTQEPFQIAHLKEQEREREAMELEMARRDAVDTANAEEQANETTIMLDAQQVNHSLQQVPPPFILPDTPQEQPAAPVIPNNALPLIVSSSAESTDAPQIVTAPDAGDSQIPEQSSSNDSKPTSSLSTDSEHSGDKTLADGSSGSDDKPRGILSNWAPAAAALKRPLAMQRSLSEFFGLKAPGPADEDRTPLAETERRVSHSSTNSDGSSLLEEGKSGILYYRAKEKRGSTDTGGSVWSHGERRNRLPEGASGVAVHKDLWKLDQMSETCDFPECAAVFSFTKRRHHCRACGQIFCTPHASFALDLWYPPTTNGEEPRSGAPSRRPSNETNDSTFSQTSEPRPDASINSLLRPLPSSRISQKGAIKPARVCEDCYDKVWNPERYVSRERARRTEPGTSNIQVDLDSDSQASNSGISLADARPASAANLLNERVLQRSRSTRSTGRRMFSAPVSPASTSPPTTNGLDATIHSLNRSISRQSSRSSSLAPPAARQNARLARNASAHGALSLRQRMPTSPGFAPEATPRPMFSPTAEALNVGPQRSLSPSGLSNTSGNGYFPAMPPPSKPFLPGEEPNQHVNGVLSNYPLAYKPATPGTAATSPYTSGPPSADLSGFPRNSKAGNRNSSYMRLDMPKNGFLLDDPMSSKASSARLLTPDREWVPGAWGYAKETFDPDVESDTEDEDDHDEAVDALARKTRSRLIVDGDIRLKTHDVVREPKPRHETQRSPAPQSPATRTMPWSTF